MEEEKKNAEQSGGVNITGSVSVGGDIVGRDKITQGDGSAAKALGNWQFLMNSKIDADQALSAEDKNDLKEQVDKIQKEAVRGEHTDPARLERLINTLAAMAPDIFDVAVATLANPLAGIGLAIHKIGDKAKLEGQAKPS